MGCGRKKKCCHRRRKPCSFDDETETTYSSEMCTTTEMTESTEPEEPPPPEISILPIKPQLLREISHAGQIFKSVLLEESMMMVKWQRRRLGSDMNHVMIRKDIYGKTGEIIEAFKRCVGTCGWKLDIAACQVVRTPPTPKHPEGRLAFIEKFVPGLRKVNSNTGWTSVTKSRPAQIIAGLCHFSYAYTKGQLLMCNVWAHFDFEEKSIMMTVPAFHTQEGGLGCTDLGVKGMRSFFCMHKINRFCSGYDMAPRKMFFKAQEETMLSC